MESIADFRRIPISNTPTTVIIDYGMGNLFSVKNACEKVGLSVTVTASRQEIQKAQAVILPGVGAFGDAMKELHRLDLGSLLKEIAASETPFFGICLGMQLLMTQSHEFGQHRGLDIIPGHVVRFEHPVEPDGTKLKVPEVQWNRVQKISSEKDTWKGTLLDGISDGAFFYFVHSFYSVPDDARYTLSTSSYGQHTYCSTLRHKNIFACQYHPERSGEVGLKMYHNFAMTIRQRFNER